MDSMNLKDFRPGQPDFDTEDDSLQNKDSEIPASSYLDEMNTLKIDKLSNRVTIISIIIPCIIGAILIFAYLDMEKRVVDVDHTKQTQVDRIAQELEEKLNALDVKIAKNKFEIDTNLPELDKKRTALEGQLTKLVNSKPDAKSMNTRLGKIEKRIANNSNQDKTLLQTIERMNKQTLSTIKENQKQFDNTLGQIEKETTLFKEEFDARLLELSDYEQQVGELRKNTSLLDKKFKTLVQDTISKTEFDKQINLLNLELSTHMKTINQEIKDLNKKLTANISRLQTKIGQSSKSSSSDMSPPTVKPKPQINIDSSGSVEIKQESLTQ